MLNLMVALFIVATVSITFWVIIINIKRPNKVIKMEISKLRSIHSKLENSSRFQYENHTLTSIEFAIAILDKCIANDGNYLGIIQNLEEERKLIKRNIKTL